MAILGVPSTSIVDSTSVGRSLITASDAAAARVIMELAAVDDVTFNSVSSVDGTFSGVVTSTSSLTLQSNNAQAKISLANSGAVTITALNSIYQQFTSSGVGYRKACYPIFNGSLDLGTNTNRWGNVYSVDGSFSGNLNVEDGGAFQFYGLGTEGDTNTEYLRFDTVGNDFELATVATGTGSAGSLYIGAGGSSNVMFRSDHTRIFQYLRPQTTNTVDVGRAGLRFRKSYFTDGDFSGDVIVAANVDFTGLPTSDPVVAGRLWNDSGTMKISAG